MKISHYTVYTLLQTLISSLKQEGERARTNLRVLETLTYSCINPCDLHELSTKLDDLAKEFRSKLPQSEGLVLQPNARRAAKRRAQKISKKYKALPLKIRRGRVRTDWKVRNRVGAKVDRLKKVKLLLN
jgi:hypothetical protein